VKALLLYRDCDFDPNFLLGDRFRRSREPEWHQKLGPLDRALVQDLELDTLLQAMAGEDEFLLDVARKAILSGFENDIDTILYRQAALRDCLQNQEATVAFYNLAVTAIESAQKNSWGLSSHYPGSMLYNAVDVLGALWEKLKAVRELAYEQSGKFESSAFTTLFAMLARELDDDYLAIVATYLDDLKFHPGVLFTAELGEWNESENYILRLVRGKDRNWFQRLFGQRPPGYTFRLDERDEAGAQILGDMRQRAISRVAVALAESADHVLSFFRTLRTELAFYLGCLNLHSCLVAKVEPISFPVPHAPGERSLSFRGLYDVCLSLQMKERVVGNSAGANGKNLVVITGANQGGKSSFLRGIGLAHLMMQCGMFIGAETFEGEICPALFTHYKRKEDSTMTSGKLDEELLRMSGIADHLSPNSIVLFNESFAATNEREGSEIARQVVAALLEKGVRVFFVTHLYEFAHGFLLSNRDAIFYRPERRDDGARTFRLFEGEPLETSFGHDLYREIFENPSGEEPDQVRV